MRDFVGSYWHGGQRESRMTNSETVQGEISCGIKKMRERCQDSLIRDIWLTDVMLPGFTASVEEGVVVLAHIFCSLAPSHARST